MVPVLKLFLMPAFAETLKIIWRQQKIPILSIMTTSKGNLIKGKFYSHTPAMFTSKKLTAYKILQYMYVGDGAFPFVIRRDLNKRMELICHHFDRFGLEMHIGQGTSLSKTKCFFFPSPCSSNAHSNVPQGLQQFNGLFVAHISATTQHR
jgi:hypothetical protein